ncbi:Nucleoside-triphosphatase THEP1 [Glycine max]|nr:Nucleoside-triphosphatase THEP1 [Glycine max]
MASVPQTQCLSQASSSFLTYKKHSLLQNGWLVLRVDGRTAPLASLDISTWPNVGKYKVDVASFESLALLELQVREDTDLFIIDEVVLASIPVPKFGRDIPEVARLRNHAGATCFTLSVSNRDAVREKIRSQLEDLLTKH